MATQTPQTPGWGLPAPQPPKQKRQFTVTKIAIGVAAGIGLFLVGVFVLIAIAIGSNTTGTGTTLAPAATEGPASPSNDTGVTDVTESPTSAYDTPTKSDFRLTLKVKSKENFGEAGSNIVVAPRLSTSANLDPDKTYEITYQITGGEDGTDVETVEATGGNYTYDEVIISTAHTWDTLHAKILSVEETSN